jgi:tRNA(Leu) C34 or U34 (ribose-2'-O)-methylase TrmL
MGYRLSPTLAKKCLVSKTMTHQCGKNSKPAGILPAIVLIQPKFSHNLGAIIRAASCFGLRQVWYTGDRIEIGRGGRLPREERMKGYKDAELIQFDYPFDAMPSSAVPVAVELMKGAEPLYSFQHPDNAVYVFGPEDGTIGKATRVICHRFVVIPSRHCFNLASTVHMVLYDRALKRWQAGIEPMLQLNEVRYG